MIPAVKNAGESFLSAVLDEPKRAIGGLLADKINSRRHRNLIVIAAQAKRNLAEAGVSPKEVPLSIIHPALEAASLEEDTNLQTVWANLLANVADPRQTNKVLPSFPIILKELTGRDVKFLDALYTITIKTIKRQKPFPPKIDKIKFREIELKDVYAKAGLSRQPRFHTRSMADWQKHAEELEADLNEFCLTLETVQRQEILHKVSEIQPVELQLLRYESAIKPQTIDIESNEWYVFTNLGFMFVGSCRKPEKIEI